MEQNLLDGLSIALSGLIITFLALALFAGVITLLGNIFKYKEPAPETTATEEAAPAVEAVTSDDSDDIPVVIATAISYFHSRTNSNLGYSLEEGKSAWWASNRMNAQQGLGIRIKRSGQ